MSRSTRSLLGGTPGALLITEELRRALYEWVGEVQSKMEDCAPDDVVLPFDDYREAFEWLKSQPGGMEPTESYDGEVRRWRSSVLYLPHPDGKDTVALRAGKGSVRYDLLTEARSMSAATGFSEPNLIRHIMAGEQLILHPVVIETVTRRKYVRSSGVAIGRTEVVVRYRTPEVSFDDSRAIHRWIRDAWDARGAKPMTENDLVLRDVVDELGRVPEERGEKTGFWEKVREQLARQGIDYKDWHGPYNAYRRLQEKLRRIVEI